MLSCAKKFWRSNAHLSYFNFWALLLFVIIILAHFGGALYEGLVNTFVKRESRNKLTCDGCAFKTSAQRPDLFLMF